MENEKDAEIEANNEDGGYTDVIKSSAELAEIYKEQARSLIHTLESCAEKYRENRVFLDNWDPNGGGDPNQYIACSGEANDVRSQMDNLSGIYALCMLGYYRINAIAQNESEPDIAAQILSNDLCDKNQVNATFDELTEILANLSKETGIPEHLLTPAIHRVILAMRKNLASFTVTS